VPLSWNEIKARALAFSRNWDGETSERAEAQSFWNDFFGVFGIERRRVAVFEKQVKLVRAGAHPKRGRIDAFWKGMLLIEHKSADQDLDRAFAQAADYFEGLPERDLPRYIIVSDFARFRLYDLDADTQVEFKLADLHKKVRHFGFVAGYRVQEIKPQDPVNIKAAEQMGRLHDLLKASGYAGHALELLLVRLLFCLFADDTGIFQPAQAFRAWLDERTAADGSDLGPQLAQLFQVLNQAEDRRPNTLDEQLRALGPRYTLAMIDIDHFKKFNDTHGHDIGDQVLKLVAARLAEVGGGGMAFRYGGEEFSVLFPGRGLKEALPFLESTRAAVERYRMAVRSEERPRHQEAGIRRRGDSAPTKLLSVTVSMGAAEPEVERQPPAQVLKAADEALYRAKKGGRNRVCT